MREIAEAQRGKLATALRYLGTMYSVCKVNDGILTTQVKSRCMETIEQFIYLPKRDVEERA